ncbi:MAG TPA: PaaI family thioesterase [Acidimicrobiales bacterium]|nr:PaaI family thioesterase [Acidimicrobiales bacterium]
MDDTAPAMAEGWTQGLTPFEQTLQLRFGLPDDGSDAVVVLLDPRDDLRGPSGSVEGGVIATLADVAGASAAARALGSMVATAQMSISFLAPARVGPIRATGVALRAGRQDAVAEVRIEDLGKDGRLVAVAHVSVKGLADRA